MSFEGLNRLKIDGGSFVGCLKEKKFSSGSVSCQLFVQFENNLAFDFVKKISQMGVLLNLIKVCGMMSALKV